MTTNEGTKALIEKARDMTLYARTTKHGAVSHADMIDDLADALESRLAARQPSDDDREALEKIVTEYDMALYTKEETLYRLSRSVPDAATEELLKRVEEAEAQSAEDRVEWQQMKERASQRFNAYQQKKRELRQMEIRAEKAEAERDAALAAIERIRQAVSGHPECDRYEEGDVISCGWKSAYASVVAALDGAPEPGDVWEYEVRNEVHYFRSDYTPDLEQARQWAQTDPHDFIVRRRKAGPWLPVDGESNGNVPD